ncbi:hypothetical protein CHUAL_002131 [Chamberlinius hualienensis]
METRSTYTTTTTSTKVIITPRFDPSYLRTIPGILKLFRMLMDLLGFICVMVSGVYYWSGANWFSFVSMTSFWVTGVLLVFYLFHLIERLHFLPWMLLEFIYNTVWTVFYLIAAAIVASLGQIEAFAAAAFFGFCAMIAYGYDAFLKFRGWRNGDLAQGERAITSTTTSSPPAY